MLEKKKIDDFSENKDLGRRLYEYKNLSDYRIKDFSTAEIDWPFPDKLLIRSDLQFTDLHLQ